MDLEDAIAIIGIESMFPGSKNVDEFWRLLKNGENHVNEIPKHRWDNDAYYDPAPNASGKLYITRVGLMDRHDEWDIRLIGISDTESERRDLQQRYTLECVHMALEDGGITRKEMNGSKTGVYIGENQMAICGSVNSIMYTETFIALCKARIMSAKGRCHAFSDMADGYARGEGCGIVILQKLDTVPHILQEEEWQMVCKPNKSEGNICPHFPTKEDNIGKKGGGTDTPFPC